MSDIRSVLNTQTFSLEENTAGSSDPIRSVIQSFWVYNGEKLTYDTRNSYNADEKTAKTSFLNFDLSKSPGTPKKSYVELDANTSIDIKTYRQRVIITPRYLSSNMAMEGRSSSGRIEADPEAQFDSYIEDSIIPAVGTPQSEFKVDLDSPIEYASNVQNSSAIAGTVNFVYNYGLEDYENQIAESAVVESQLNNFYKFDKTAAISIVSPSARSVLDLSVSLPVPLTKQRVSKRLNGSPTSTENIQDFFMNSEGFIEALELQEKKDTFPFYNEVYFTTPADKLSNDKVEDAFKNSGLLMAFCDLMNREDIRATSQDSLSTIRNAFFSNSYLSSSYTDATQQQFIEKSALRVSEVRMYDIPAMLQIMYKVIPRGTAVSKDSVADRAPINSVDTTSLRSKAFLTDGEQAKYRLDTISKIKAASNTSIDYENALDDFVEEINNLISNLDNFKSYREILEGNVPTYQSNVLFYRIKKFEQGSDTPIQNFWIPAEKGYKGIRYIDTQVKYGKMYRYEVCAFKIVMGSDYEFSQDDVGVINFDEDLADFLDASQENLENLFGLALIKPAIEQTAAEVGTALPSELGFGTLNVDRLLAASVADFIEDKNILSSDLVKVDGYTLIADFARQAIEGNPLFPGKAVYRGEKIEVDQLTEEEMEKLKVINQSWDCLTNSNKTEPNKLAEIEILLNKVIALGNIREETVKAYEKKAAKKEKWKKFWKTLGVALGATLLAIGTGGAALAIAGATVGVAAPALLAGGIAAATGGLGSVLGATLGGSSKRINSTGIDVNDLNKNELEALYAEIDKLKDVTRAPLSIGADDRYWIDLDDPFTFKGSDPDLAEEFTLLGRREVLPLYKFGEKRDDEKQKDFEERKRYHIELVESIFELRAKQLTTLVDDYLGCYYDFVKAASDVNIVLDYKRINKYVMTAQTTPTVKFAELPYYSSEGMILDNPPIYPNVNVVTYRGIADKLSFFMNSGQGEIEIKPVSFSDEEDVFIANYRKSKKLNDFQPFLYKSDEKENLGTVFEIRRLEEPPKDYQSFRTAKVSTVVETLSNGKSIPAATFDEQIMSNKKYYYIFRVSDRRGTISYPSGVMEIEIVENSGIIYPLIQPYEFEKPKTDTTKNLKRLLNIVPRITQVVPPADTSSYKKLTAGATTILGREEEGLFGKQFKLRLTSKKTGKVVDLNLNFNATVIETTEAE